MLLGVFIVQFGLTQRIAKEKIEAVLKQTLAAHMGEETEQHDLRFDGEKVRGTTRRSARRGK